jgi:SAM-dependent methyltransferase
MSALSAVWQRIPGRYRTRLLAARRWVRRKRPGRAVRWGNLRARAPFSTDFALDRGLPIDRHYIGKFVAAHAQDITGSVMEMSRSTYTDAYGSEVGSRTIVDIDTTNEQATHVCDLCVPGSLPVEAFDCIVFTQTLQYLPDLDTAIANLWQALRPGGVLLMTVPALARDDPIGGDYWRFTPSGLRRALEERLPDGATIDVVGSGNAVAAAAQMLATSVEDLGVHHLAEDDPGYPVIVGARVVRPR